MTQTVPIVLTPKRFADYRGWFSETYHEQRLHDLGISCRFVQDNQSYSKQAGTIRGFHFQRPPAAQAKLISVINGRILDVAVDIRHGSPTYGRNVSAELSSDNGRQFFVPAGFAHAFLTLEDNVTVAYKVSAHYAPTCEDGLSWNDPQVAFSWPFDLSRVTIAQRDLSFRPLDELQSPFIYDGVALESQPPVEIAL